MSVEAAGVGSLAVAFLAGVLRDALCVAWSRTVQGDGRDSMRVAMAITVADSAAMRFGLGESLIGPGQGIAWVLGSAVGTYLTLRLWPRRRPGLSPSAGPGPG